MTRRLGDLVKFILLSIAVAAIIEQLRRPDDERTWTGRIGPVPYDFRLPTPERVINRWWNPDDSRLLTPHTWGVGWSINLYQLLREVRGERS